MLQCNGGLRGLLKDVGVNISKALEGAREEAGVGQEGEELLLGLCFPLELYDTVEGQLRKYKRNLLKRDSGVVPIRTLLSARCVAVES